MPLDGLAVRCLAEELDSLYTFARIQNINMPAKNEVIMNLYMDNASVTLTVSCDPGCPGIYIQNEKRENPKTPYNFCMFLRKHIGGGKIVKIYAKDYERIIYFDITHTDELLDISSVTLICELTGRNCNMILVNKDNRIIEALRHVDEEMSSVRRIMPAEQYVMPPTQDKIPIDEITFRDLIKFSDSDISHALLDTIKGCAPLFAREICERASVEEDKTVRDLDANETTRLFDSMEKISKDIESRKYKPIAIYEKGRKNMKDFYCFDLSVYRNSASMIIKEYDTFLRVYTDYVTKKNDLGRLTQSIDSVKKIVNTILAKLVKKICIYRSDIDDLDKVKKYQLYGELLTANMHVIKDRRTSVTVVNYYTNGSVDIPLDASKDIQRNAQIFYKKYKKGMATYEYASKKIIEARVEEKYLMSVVQLLNACESIEDTKDINKELIQQGYIKEKVIKKGGKLITQNTPIGFSPVKYISSEGYEIYAGRNNTENDRLTFGSSPNDVWMHIKDMHGSHVIIRNPSMAEEFVPDRTLTEGAVIAAYHSEARKSGQTAVDYTFVKNVKKPKGAKPGMVNYFKYYSAYVKCDEDLVERSRVSKL